MKSIFHWTTRIEPSKVIASGIYAAALITCANILASVIKPSETHLTVWVSNSGNVKAYEIVDGQLVPIERKK